MSANSIEGQVKAGFMAALALDKKADGLKILKVSEQTSYADYLVLCSAASERQAQAVARHIIDELRLAGLRPLGQEGMDQGHWVLLDYGEVVVHIFFEGARSYYDLDGFWVDAPSETIDEAASLALLKEVIAARVEERKPAAL
jgi:ribosome-associated protein